MKVSFEGIDERIITFYNHATSPAVAGHVVKMNGSATVSSCINGERVFGVAVACDGEFVAVQNGGYVELPYTGSTTPTSGFVKLLANGAGAVKVDAAGAEFKCVYVDADNKIIGVIM